MGRARSLYRIGISGSFGGLNLGDEAILQTMIAQLRRSLPVEICVFSRNPADTLRRHGVERAIPVRSMSRADILPEIRRLDFLLIGGGGILFDAEAKFYLREALLAQQVGVPYMLYAVGIGPLEDPGARQLVREAVRGAAAVTVRERRALQLLEELDVDHQVVVTADPAFLLEPEPLPPDTAKREALDHGRRLVGISVREPGAAAPDINQNFYHALIANAADFISDRFDADVVFVPMERNEQDTQHAHAVIALMLRAPRASVLKGNYTPGQLMALLGHFSFAVGMRLHFLILAALQGIPTVALPYASKVHGLLESFKIEMPPLRLVNSGRLIAYMDHSWDHRRSLVRRINRALPALKDRARKTHEIAVELIQSKRL